jgi:general secretion pathway protein N
MLYRKPQTPPRRVEHTPWRWAGAGALLGLLCTVIWQAPAAWLATAVEQLTAGRVILADARGTAWTGSARLVLAGGTGSRDAAALPGRLDWRVRPDGSGLAVQLEAACCTPTPVTLTLAPRWGGIRLDIPDGTPRPQAPTVWPAALLTGLGAPWNTLQAEGQLHLKTQGFSAEWTQGRLTLTGNAELTATGMSSRLSTLRPMGSYRLSLQGGKLNTLELSTVEGSLQLTGTGRWVGGRLRFEGVASAAPEREAALSNLLNIIGRRQGARSIITVG